MRISDWSSDVCSSDLADSVTLSEDPDPNVTGNVLEVGGVGAAPGTLRRVLSTPHATAGIATRIWPSNLGSVDSAPWFFSFRDGAKVSHVYIAMTTTGVVSAYRVDRISVVQGQRV